MIVDVGRHRAEVHKEILDLASPVAIEVRLGPNNNWVETGPHVMIVGAKGLLDAYPRNAKPDTSVPYVMWPDTRYEHLMIPVR